MQLIPGHKGIEGNERADVLAREASKLPQSGIPTPFSSIKVIINKKIEDPPLSHPALRDVDRTRDDKEGAAGPQTTKIGTLQQAPELCLQHREIEQSPLPDLQGMPRQRATTLGILPLP